MSTTARDLTSQVDGARTVFTTPDTYAAGTLAVHWNGARLEPAVDFTETTGTTFTWAARPKFAAPKVGDTLVVQYEIPLVTPSGIDPES